MSIALQTGSKYDPAVEGNYVVSFDRLRMSDVDSVGGKNSSLGEMISQLAEAGVRVTAVTSGAVLEIVREALPAGPSAVPSLGVTSTVQVSSRAV